jgi:hypothetical protein
MSVRLEPADEYMHELGLAAMHFVVAHCHHPRKFVLSTVLNRS